MSTFTPEQRYEMLATKTRKGIPLTKEEEQFVLDFAAAKLRRTLSDPKVMAVFIRMKDR